MNQYLSGSIKYVAIAAVMAVGLPVGVAQAQTAAEPTAVVHVSCLMPGERNGSSRRDRGKKNFAFEASENTDPVVVRRLSAAETCTDAMAGLKSGDPNPKCSVSAVPHKYAYSCDLTTLPPPGG